MKDLFFACFPRLAACLLLVGSAQLAFSADWLTAVSGDWVDGSNWSVQPNYPGDEVVGPIATTIAHVEPPITVAVDSPIEIADLSLRSADVTLNLGEAGALQIGNAGKPHTPNCDFFPCSGPILPPDGVNYIEGVVADLVVGRSSTAAIAKQLGGAVSVSNGVLIGTELGEIGEYTVSGGSLDITGYWSYVPCCFIPGPGAWLQSGGEMRIGGAGVGSLNLEGGGTVAIPRSVPVIVGDQLGSHGSIHITDAGSKLSVERSIGDAGRYRTIVGKHGVGSITVEAGGAAKLGAITLGQTVGSHGTLAVSGAGSVLETDESISVSSGTVSVSASAKLMPGYGLGLNPIAGSTAELVIEGSGTLFDGWLQVAGADESSAEIRDGATATSYWASVTGADSVVAVDGPDTQWLIVADNYVPGINSYLRLLDGGAVYVSGGAYVASKRSWIGYGSGAEALVSLDGANTKWDVFDGLYVGGTAPENGPRFGEGTLRLANMATVGATSGLKVWDTGTVEGSGTIEGDLDSEGALSVGQALGVGRLEVTGDLLQRGVLEIDVIGLNPATGFDQVLITGTADLGGVLEVHAATNLDLLVGERVIFLQAEAGILNVFDSALLPTLDDGRSFHLFYDDTTVGLEVVLNGDFDGDGQVTLADYATWRSSFGATGEGLPSDANGDGVVNAADYTVWRDAFSAVANSVSVPEPTGYLLLASALSVAVPSKPRIR